MSAVVMSNASVVVSLLLGALSNANELGTLLAKVHAENRDVTSAELDALFADDDVAKARLQAAIDRARQAQANQVPPQVPKA